MMTPTPLARYFDLLAAHDWTWPYSDSPAVARAAREREVDLRAIAEQSAEHRRLFDAFDLHRIDGSPPPARPPG
jgi:hypothetical protein